VSDSITHNNLVTIGNALAGTLSVSDSITHNNLVTIGNTLAGTLNTAIYGNDGTTDVQVKVDSVGNVSTIGYQLGSYANGINNGSIISASAWIDISDYKYIICYYQDANPSILNNPTIQFSFTNDNSTLIIPNITINTVSDGVNRYGRIDKTYTTGINYIRVVNNSINTLTNVYFTITGCK
jgi:hypothetical protein